ncbi:response regulator modulated diguanylate cyclase (GGDEF domain) [Desulfosarcina variabilis str. Montpellier]
MGEYNAHDEVIVLLRLLPKYDLKQRIRAKRALQAMAGAGIQSLVSILLFFAGAFRLELQGFALLMLFLWLSHISLYLAIRLGFNKRFADPSMTREMVIWAVVVLLINVFFMDRFRPLIMMFFPIVLIYGAFWMTTRQYLATAALMVFGYVAVMAGIYSIRSQILVLGDELVVGSVFILVIIAFSFVSNEISLSRKKLRQRNAELATVMGKIEHMAITDELTGLINRRHMIYMLERQKSLVDRGGTGFCICFFDIDHFKTINDALGHHVGDIVLQRFASAIKKELRASDLFARFGGEEFVFMAFGVDLNGAKIAANRLRKTVEQIDFKDISPGLNVTISGGVAKYRSKEKVETILSRADRALYLAKNSGRNCIKMENDG